MIWNETQPKQKPQCRRSAVRVMMIVVCDEQQSYNPTSTVREPWEENNYAKQPSARIMCAYGIFTNAILAHISRHRCAQRQPPLLTASWKFMAHPPNKNKTNKYDAVTDHSCTQMVVSQWGFVNCPWYYHQLYGGMHTYGYITLDSPMDKNRAVWTINNGWRNWL